MIAAMPLKVSGQRLARPSGRAQRLASSARSVVVRASSEEPKSSPVTYSFDESSAPAASTSGVSTSSSSSGGGSAVLGTVQEAINGRAAMLGFVSAVAAEALTHHSVMSQLGGKYVDLELVEKPIGLSPLLYFAIIALVTVGSIAPKLLEGLEPSARSFGPFTPARELMLGRVAMLGFLGLIVVETIKGSSLL